MKIICTKTLVELASSGPKAEEYKARWQETFLGDFEQSFVYKTMKGTDDDGDGEDKKVSQSLMECTHPNEVIFY